MTSAEVTRASLAGRTTYDEVGKLMLNWVRFLLAIKLAD